MNDWEAALEKYDLKRREDENQKGPRIRYEDGTKPNISPEQISESKETIKYKNHTRTMTGYNKTLIKRYLYNSEYWIILKIACGNGFNLMKYRHKVKNLTEKCKCGETIRNVKKHYFEHCPETEDLRN